MWKKSHLLNRVAGSFAKGPWIVVVDIIAKGLYCAGVGTEQADNQLHQCRLAAAALAENGCGLAELEIQRDIFEGEHIAAAQ